MPSLGTVFHWWSKDDQTPKSYFKSLTIRVAFFLFFIFYWRIIAKLCWFLPYINMDQSKAYICPLLHEIPFPLLPHPTLLGCHRTLIWVPWVMQQISPAILHMLVYIFPCYSLHSKKVRFIVAFWLLMYLKPAILFIL